jgi:hypothetical protein
MIVSKEVDDTLSLTPKSDDSDFQVPNLKVTSIHM